jgi:maltose alpha-D-glucosyltransferase/alpha-amylase
MKDFSQHALEYSLIKEIEVLRWFQNKDSEVVSAKIIDYLELNESTILALVEFGFANINSPVLYLIFLDSSDESLKLFVEDSRQVTLLMNKLQSFSELSSKLGKVSLNKYSPLPSQNEVFIPLIQGSSNSLYKTELNLLKIYRKVEFGEHPEEKLLSQLKNTSLVPEIKASLSWSFNDQKLMFGIEQELLTNEGSLWDWFLIQLKDESNLVNPLEISTTFAELGKVLAQFHNQLYSLGGVSDCFKTSNYTEVDLEKVILQIQEFYADNESLLSSTISKDCLAKFIESQTFCYIQSQNQQLEKSLGLKFKQHGDFHLGQVLKTQNTVKIIDLEGQPASSLEERWQAASSLQDIASLLRSIQYAVAITSKNLSASDKSLINVSALSASNVFLQTYLQNIKFTLPDPVEPMLKLQILLKTFQELDYEKKSRPDYVWICFDALRDQLQAK